MKGLLHLVSRQHEPTGPDNAGALFPAKFLRTGKQLSGAFLFLALTAAVFYGSGSADDVPVKQANTPATDTSNVQPMFINETPPDSAAQSSNKSEQSQSNNQRAESSSVSTSVNTVNGQTEVTVNGQPITPDASGTVSETIDTANGSVQIHVTQNGSAGGSSSVNSFSSSASSSWNFKTEHTFDSP